MRNNEELLEKIKLMNRLTAEMANWEEEEIKSNEELLEKTENRRSQIFGDEAEEAFIYALSKVAEAALESVKDAINPVQNEELVFLVPALKVFAESLEVFFNEEKKVCAESTYDIMKIMVNGVEEEV